MLTTLKSEFLKFFTVKSTYIWTGIMLAITLFTSVYVYGYRQTGPPAAHMQYEATYMVLGFFGMASTILAVLLVTHEYRHRMIDYTFTASRSRLAVLLSKALVMLAYALIGGLIVGLLCYIGLIVGLSFKDLSLQGQDFPILESLGSFAAYLISYTMVGLIFGLLFRSVVIAIVAYFVIPSIEGIASLVLKSGGTKYLPFHAFDSTAISPSVAAMSPDLQTLSNGAAIAVSFIYIVVLFAIAAFLFIKRDAS